MGGEISQGKSVRSKEDSSIIYTSDPKFHDIQKNWNLYLKKIVQASEPTDEEYIKNQFKISTIPEQLATELLESLEKSTKLEFFTEDCDIRYVACRGKANTPAAQNIHFSYFSLSPKQLDLISTICEEMRPCLEACLGTPFRVFNVRAIETRSKSEGVGPNKLHKDGVFPAEIHKVLLYLTSAGLEIGTTGLTIKRHKKGTAYVEGPPGTFVFFNPVKTQHKGIPPKKIGSVKITVEIILCPSYETDISPFVAGTNSLFPIDP